MSRTGRMGFAPLLLLALLPTAWTEATEVQVPFASNAVKKLAVPGDFNADFQTDVLWQTPRGNLMVWLMEGLKPVQRLATNPFRMADAGWRASGTHDFDADGNTDILWFHPENGTLAIWHMDGLNLVYEAELSERVFDAVPLSIFDFNGDNHPDILFQTTQGELIVHILFGSRVIERISLDLPGPRAGWRAVGAGDFDGDGNFDIVLYHHVFSPCLACASADSNDFVDLVAVALMDGTGPATSRLVVVGEQPDRNQRIGAVADYNGDFSPDLIWYNTLTGEAAAWVMDGLKIRKSLLIATGGAGAIVGPR